MDVVAAVRLAVLVLHVAAGAVALGLAAVLLLGRRPCTGRVGTAYGTGVTVVGVTAVALAGPGSELPVPVRAVLVVVAVATVAAAAVGLRRHRRAAAGERLLHGSVVSLLTAVAVVSTPPAVWVAVAVTGTAGVELRLRARAARAPRPGAPAAR